MLRRPMLTLLRATGSIALLAAVSACAGHPQQSTHLQAVQEAAQYQARAARGSYTPPGTPEDPWGPYITEASKRFDVPERWIREVMRQESGGRLFSGDGLTTSPVGAMGLMQVMPGTYDILRARYNLSDDAYDPHNNILAGTAYIREMYDLYGSPGFLAAYNAGPGRLDDYLTRNRPLPLETRRYVAAIGPYIADSFPVSRSPVDQYAMNKVPANIPAGPRYASLESEPVPEPVLPPVSAPVPDVAQAPAPRPVHLAANQSSSGLSPEMDLPIPPVAPPQGLRLARAEPQLPAGHARSEPPATEVAELPEPPRPSRGLHLIQPAMAETLSSRHGGGWAVQVGAFGKESQAHDAAARAAREAGGHVSVGTVTQGHSTLFRARLTGLSRESATEACHRLAKHVGCMVLSPQSQS